MISSDLQTTILDTYKASERLYADLAKVSSNLLETLLANESLQVHAITNRCKHLDSLERKLAHPEKSYESISDITDLTGVRITTYFADDVDKVAVLIEREFLLDASSSVDKRKLLDPDRFGYQSLHYVVSISPARLKLAEYRRFADIRFEIQIRSILQHAWAEIEHDLGYKSAIGVPIEVRRRFSRVAGLLELADIEFSSIRNELQAYEIELPEQIGSNPHSVDLDLPSLRALYQLPTAVAALDQAVVKAGGGTLSTDLIAPDRMEDFLKPLREFGITSIGQLEDIAKSEFDTVQSFVKYWISTPLGDVNAGIGVFYLLYVLAWRTSDIKRIYSYLNMNSLGLEEERIRLASRILEFRK